MRTSVFLGITLTIFQALAAGAQQSAVGDSGPGASSAYTNCVPSADPAATASESGCVRNHLLPNSVPVTKRPADVPKLHSGKQRVAGPEFLLWTVATGAATVLDVESTALALQRPGAQEGNSWIYGTHPTRGRMYAINVPVDILFAYLAYRAKSHPCTSRCGMWRFPLAALTIVHTTAGTANMLRLH